MINRNDPCWCGSGQKWKKCHYPAMPQIDFKGLAREYKKHFDILLKTPEQIEGIRNSCKLAASILQATCKMAKAGVTTNELNDFADKLHQKAGAIPAPLGYGEPPFPKSICTSLNDVICHGIPDDQPLVDGDIVNIDITCILNGYYGDCSAMVEIGKVSPEKHKVVQVSKECLRRAIQILKPGVLVNEIGKAIEDYAREHHCSVVNQFVGHGVGVGFHEPPQIPHHYNNIEIPLVEGMTFTIEPMINAGVREGIIDPVDQWTTRTVDGKPSAQWEHTILITPTGYEILTLL
ncbi:MAG TPA: methionyl aminopeptidase [Rhabdochlamydiaceae bacterium]|nr:methionyl aminopeptidase [Rhabdochlamydiaceae bacterium]